MSEYQLWREFMDKHPPGTPVRVRTAQGWKRGVVGRDDSTRYFESLFIPLRFPGRERQDFAKLSNVQALDAVERLGELV